MKDYTVTFNYRRSGGPNAVFTVRVAAYNKGEAMIRAGARYRESNGGLPDVVDGITVTPHSRNGFIR